MAALMRLLTLACGDLADALVDESLLERELERDIADGRIDPDEARRLRHLVATIRGETLKASVNAEKTDEVLAKLGFRLTHGEGVEPHYYLKAKRRDVAELEAQQAAVVQETTAPLRVTLHLKHKGHRYERRPLELHETNLESIG